LPVRARQLLFVCSGNTCRSPLAGGILRAKINLIPNCDLSVESAGIGAMDGFPASQGAISAGAEIGIDLSTHRSCALDSDTLSSADIVLVMTRSHKGRILSEYPDFVDRVFLLKEFGAPSRTEIDVEDPFGGDITVYRKCREELESEIIRILPLLTGSSPMKEK